MTSTERERRSDVLEAIQHELNIRCKHVTVRGERFWAAEDGTIFRPSELDGEYALVIEWAESVEEAEKFRAEDADVYQLDAYDSADQLLHDMLSDLNR